ncbi:MAG: lecithin retinol acyltransferase family protein [Fibrobacter sp.]|jgi:hypothetical protein|nr:lecithin retinol acyltransferase family protein [Fibrobacter sp.]
MNNIDESKLPEPPVGAHLISPRKGFHHHGLYVGNGKVIHYSGMARTLRFQDLFRLPKLFRYGAVVKTSMKRFCEGHGFKIKEHPQAKFPGDLAVTRAKKRLYERSYYLYSNNCEHFVNWCLDDTFRSPFITRLLWAFALVGFLVHRWVVSKFGIRMSEQESVFVGGFFAIAGALGMGHLTMETMQPAKGIRGRERHNRYIGRIGTRLGVFLAIPLSLLGIKCRWRLFAAFVPYFVPIWSGIGAYFIARDNDMRERIRLREERQVLEQIQNKQPSCNG